MSDILSDLVSEGRKAMREKTIQKAAQKAAEEKSRKPLEDGPPIRADIYQQLEWKALSIILLTTYTTCRCCGNSYESPNPTVFVERHHRRHGRHLVEAHNFNLLPRKQWETLPRKVETRYCESLYCHKCFTEDQEPLCLEQNLNPLTQESSPLTSLPCVQQLQAIPSQWTLWSDTLGKTSKSMNDSSNISEMSRPQIKGGYY